MSKHFPSKITLEWCLQNTESALGPEKEPEVKKGAKMPFGKYKGKPLEEIPASYYNWLWTNGMEKKKDFVACYIRQNLVTLKKEYPYEW